jgi:hypothetical protein
MSSFCLAVVEQEVSNREENTRKQRIRQAKFPATKDLAQYDFLSLTQSQ